MRALQLCWRTALVKQGILLTPAYAQPRRFAATGTLRDVKEEEFLDGVVHSRGDNIDEDDEFTAEADDDDVLNDDPQATSGQPRTPLAVELLPYAYSPLLTNTTLALPRVSHSLERIQTMLGVYTEAELLKVFETVTLDSDEAATHYVNVVGAYMRRVKTVQERLHSPHAAVRQRAAAAREDEKGCYLTPQEQLAVVTKAATLIEQRRVPIVVASRLLRFRWPTELRSHCKPITQRYIMQLVRNWAAEELRDGQLSPRDARALLSNCSGVLKVYVQQQKQQQLRAARRGDEAAKTSTSESFTDASFASFMGSLAAKAVEDITTPAQAEGLISVMWAVYSSGCTAPASFWDDMVQRVVLLNSTMDSQLAEPTSTESQQQQETKRAGGKTRTTNTTKRREATTPQPTGHFFSTLTTRQLYRFLLVLKRVRWAGDVAVLHEIAEQTLRNVAFELETVRLSEAAETTKNDDDVGDTKTTAEDAQREKEEVRKKVDKTKSEESSSSSSPVEPTAESTSALTERLRTKHEVAQRIRLVADMQPREFLGLLSLAADLRVPFGVSATRVSEELLTPLVPHLTTRELITLLQVVRHTQSQSAELLQTVMTCLIHYGPAIPYALALSKMLVRTAANAPTLFASLEMDEFVGFFLDLCESQFTVCRASEVAGLGELLYLLGRRFDEPSAPGQRIRAVLNLFCGHMDRLLQLNAITPALVETMLESTVLLRMRADTERYPAVQDLLRTRAVVTKHNYEKQTERRERQMKLVAAAAKETQSAQADAEKQGGNKAFVGRSPRWESLSEQDLPRLSKSALEVYREMTYMFERMVVVRAQLSNADFRIFERDVEKAGLYSLLQGVQLFQHGHLDAEVAYTTPTAAEAAAQISRAFPLWMERKVNGVVLRKIERSRLSETSSDDAVLKVLGHVHCDAAKVDAVIALIVQSPLQMLKRQRSLWLYVRELASRFGSEETQKAVAAHLSKSLY